MKTKKRLLSVLLACVMLALAAPAAPAPATAYAADGSWFFYLMPSDTQAYRFGHDLTYGGNSFNAWRERLPEGANGQQVYLARNEAEGFQIYFTEYNNTDGGTRDLRVTVDPFVNGAGDTLACTLFREIYMAGDGMDREIYPYVAEALLPYGGEAVTTTPNDNMMFYAELRAGKEQTPGDYRSVVKLYDGDVLLASRPVTATVWHFALPEAHYAATVFGLYNSNSGYAATSGFLRACGVRFTEAERLRDEDIVPEDRALAEEILEAWQEVLLQHGVSTYELPRFLMETDEKAAALTMADPRRKAFAVPLLNADVYQGAFNEQTEDTVLRYKDIVYGNAFLKDKAFFYPEDEQDWSSGTPDARFLEQNAAIRRLWPGAHVTVPMNSYNGGNLAARRGNTDVLCMSQSLLYRHAGARSDFTDGTWFRTWRYPDEAQLGSFYLYTWAKNPMGVYHRILYWQQALLHSDGMLNWNCAYLPVNADGSAYDVWENNTLPALNKVNGDGLLIYPGTALGLPADEPVVSLRLKQIASGLDDYDYLRLTEEFLGADSEAYRNAIDTVLPKYRESGLDHIWNANDVDFNSWSAADMNRARETLGKALDAAWTAESLDHAYSDWAVAVEPDAAHNGLAIRTCADCGAQESKKIFLCGDGSHDDSVFTQIDGNVHLVTCAICGRTRTEAHVPVPMAGKPATCTEDGCTAGVICEKCGAALEETVILPAGHTLGEWVPEIAADCMREGVKGHFTCAVCKKDFDRDGNALGSLVLPVDRTRHTGGRALTGVKAATCTAAGYTGDTVCAGCGGLLAAGSATAPAGHRWDAGSETRPATCAGDGEKVFTCTVCGETKKETLPKRGHTAPDSNGRCARCGAQLTDVCRLCGGTHTGFPGVILGFFHRIVYFFKTLF